MVRLVTVSYVPSSSNGNFEDSPSLVQCLIPSVIPSCMTKWDHKRNEDIPDKPNIKPRIDRPYFEISEVPYSFLLMRLKSRTFTLPTGCWTGGSKSNEGLSPFESLDRIDDIAFPQYKVECLYYPFTLLFCCLGLELAMAEFH